MKRMRVGSMFAGIGGICLAFINAGAEIVWANENDRYACITYTHNFGSSFLVEKDVRKVNPSDVPEFDILTAGFPCQPFSVMGAQKGFKDPRGTMFFEILRLIDSKRPKVVVLENVKNLLSHDKGQTFLTIYHSLASRDYAVKYAILGANTHGNTPQYRDRIFIVAFLDYSDTVRFSFPEPVTLTETINDVIDRTLSVSESFYYGPSSRYYDALDKRMDDDAIYRIDDSGVAMRAWTICPTLKANMGTFHDRVPLIRDFRGIRKLTPDECLALQGFPSGFGFPRIAQNEMYKQIGNTVCVPVVERIAKRILSIYS